MASFLKWALLAGLALVARPTEIQKQDRRRHDVATWAHRPCADAVVSARPQCDKSGLS
jgi:hypothetical protein